MPAGRCGARAETSKCRWTTPSTRCWTACAGPRPESGPWIDGAYLAVYRELFALGWAHSVEVWQAGDLAGGLLGVELGGLFCGESMFHRATDASKAAVWATCVLLRGAGTAERLFDVQWLTDHLASLGAVEVRRTQYLQRLPVALAARAGAAPDPARGPAGAGGRSYSLIR